MRQARRERINELADTVRTALELRAPVDVTEAVERLNGRLDVDETLEFEAQIEKVGEGFRICISDQFYQTRQRFSVAHELGHLFLHMGYLIDDEKWKDVGTYTDSVYYRYGYNTEEYEANEFAAAFLMPRADFIAVANQHRQGRQYFVKAIANHFPVSEEAALNRGRWLNLFSWE